MEKEKFKLCLYVAGQTQKSQTAIENLQRYCQDHLAGNYTIEIIDLREHPHLAEGEQIIQYQPSSKSCLIRSVYWSVTSAIRKSSWWV